MFLETAPTTSACEFINQIHSLEFFLLSSLIAMMSVRAFHRFLWPTGHMVARYTDDSITTFIPMAA